MDRDLLYMRQAMAQARLAQETGEVPVGAVVVRDGQVIGQGRNAPIGRCDATAHAEVQALREASRALGNYRLDGCTLYVTLEPCPMCAGAILHSRVARVVYGAKDPKTGAAGSVLDLFAIPQLNHQTQVEAGLLADECGALLRGFFQHRRREQARQAQPLRDDALRTPEAAFADAPCLVASDFFIDDGATQGWRMHYQMDGPADAETTVLCLHDIPGSGQGLQSLARALGSAGFRVAVPDLIGFGRSDKPKKESAHTAAMHLRSLQVLTQLAPKRLAIVGEGGGGCLAAALGSGLKPEKVPVFAVPAQALSAPDMGPYPGRGYQAALRASAGLIGELQQAGFSLQTAPVTHLEGDATRLAEQLLDTFSNG